MARSRSRAPDLPAIRMLPFHALRERLREGYTRADLVADLLAGTTVAIAAVPLSLALAIASGVPPEYGLYTAAVAGSLTALLGGSRMQVTGPTAAFVVLLAPISAKFGIAGLACASLVAGVGLLLLGLARLGRAIEFVPYPVTTGFTAGIAVVIAMLQLDDFLGLDASAATGFLERVFTLWEALGTWTPAEATAGFVTLALLLGCARFAPRIPPALVALPLVAVAAHFVGGLSPDLHVETVADRFSHVEGGAVVGGIPSSLPAISAPWNLPGPNGGQLTLTPDSARSIVLAGLAIALLGAIESLLSAVVADGIAGTRHDPDSELLALGAGNLVAPFVGGFAATGALARTALNVRSGARSPLAAVFHAVLVLAAVLLAAPLLGALPMAALAALLLRVAWQMSEARHFLHMFRLAPRGDVLLLLTCFVLTVFFDMVIAVGTGVILGALLFMRKMADAGGVRAVAGGDSHGHLPVPHGATVFAFHGPLFFGSAGRAMRTLRQFGDDARVVVLDLTDVPDIDATGLANLETCVERVRGRGGHVVVAGVRSVPLRALVRAGWRKRRDHLLVRRDLGSALEEARRILEGPAP